jgi:signal transduction histidine kinase
MSKLSCHLLDVLVSLEPHGVALSITPTVWREWWLVTCIGVLGLLTAFALHRVRLARLLELERVRMRIATDLHDDIGSGLTQIAILSEVVQRHTTCPDPAVVEPLARVSETARELVDSMSEIVWAINPRYDRLQDLAARMRRFAADVLGSQLIGLRFRTLEPIFDAPMGADHRRECFLVFKEAIHNAVRHAACTEVAVEITRAGRSLVLSVSDNGIGFNVPLARQGQGLFSMRARARAIGGRLEITSRPGCGTTLRLIVPMGRRATVSRDRVHPTLPGRVSPANHITSDPRLPCPL